MDIRCPITREIMYDPVVASDGVIYEREALEKWLSIHKHSPVTKNNMKNKYFPCSSVKRYIDQFLTDNPKKRDKQYVPSLDYKDNKNEIAKFINANVFDKLLKYKNYDAIDMYSSMDKFLKNCNQPDIIKHVIENGANIDKYRSEGKNILHFICGIRNSLSTVKFLIENIKMDPEATTYMKQKPIHCACACASACAGNNTDIAKYLIELGVDLEYEDNEKNRPIHYACKNNNLELVKLLADKINLECENSEKIRPIHYACMHNNVELVQLLIYRNVNLECKDIHGSYPLHYATIHNNFDVVKLLLENGVNLEYIDSLGKQPIHYACSLHTVNIAKLLLERNVNLEHMDSSGKRPIHYACMSGYLDMIKILVEHNVNLECCDNEGMRPIHYVASQHNIDSILYLNEKNVDMNCTNNNNYTPIHLFCITQDFKTIKHLICIIPNIDLNRENNSKRRPIDYILLRKENVGQIIDMLEYMLKLSQGLKLTGMSLYYICQGRKDVPFELVKYVVENTTDEIDFEFADDAKNRLIHHLCEKSDLQTIQYVSKLKQRKCGNQVEVGCKDNSGALPIDIACRLQKKPVVKYLLDISDISDKEMYYRIISALLSNKWYDLLLSIAEKGHDVKHFISDNIRTSDITSCDLENLKMLHTLCPNIINKNLGSDKYLIHEACSTNKLEIVKYLVENGANPEVTYFNKSRPIHFACQKASIELIDYLISDIKVDIECNGGDNRRPIGWACAYNKADVIKYLVDKNVSLDKMSDGKYLTDIIQFNYKLSNEEKMDCIEYILNKMYKN